MTFVRALVGIGVRLLSSLILILIGVVYFMLTIWMIKLGAHWAGYAAVEGSWIVLTAGIVTAAAIIGSAIQK